MVALVNVTFSERSEFAFVVLLCRCHELSTVPLFRRHFRHRLLYQLRRRHLFEFGAITALSYCGIMQGDLCLLASASEAYSSFPEITRSDK